MDAFQNRGQTEQPGRAGQPIRYSPLFSPTAEQGLYRHRRVLRSLDALQHIRIIRAEDGTIEVDMVRLHLKFFVNKDGPLDLSKGQGTGIWQGPLRGQRHKRVLWPAISGGPTSTSYRMVSGLGL